MTKKENNPTFVRTIVLSIMVFIFITTIHTLNIAFTLTMISQENVNAESWRINSQGSTAANAVYKENQEIRTQIYNSSNIYTKWFSNTNELMQIVVILLLLLLSAFSCYVWYLYIKMKIRHLRKRLNRNINQKRNHSNRQTA